MQGVEVQGTVLLQNHVHDERKRSDEEKKISRQLAMIRSERRFSHIFSIRQNLSRALRVEWYELLVAKGKVSKVSQVAVSETERTAS